MILYKALATLLLDEKKMYRRYCDKEKNQKSCYFIQNYLPVITSMYLFYSVSNIDISKYRMFYCCSIKFAITNVTLAIYFYDDKN